ncbi:MAG: hypothetical protein WAT93_11995 [Pontixanthobacter sp.]
MERRGEEIHINEQEASGGQKSGVMRWVLGASLLLAVVAMSAVWIIPALS